MSTMAPVRPERPVRPVMYLVIPLQIGLSKLLNNVYSSITCKTGEECDDLLQASTRQ